MALPLAYADPLVDPLRPPETWRQPFVPMPQPIIRAGVGLPPRQQQGALPLPGTDPTATPPPIKVDPGNPYLTQRIQDNPNAYGLLAGGLETIQAASQPGASALGSIAQGAAGGINAMLSMESQQAAKAIAAAKTAEESRRYEQQYALDERGVIIAEHEATTKRLTSLAEDLSPEMALVLAGLPEGATETQKQEAFAAVVQQKYAANPGSLERDAIWLAGPGASESQLQEATERLLTIKANDPLLKTLTLLAEKGPSEYDKAVGGGLGEDYIEALAIGDAAMAALPELDQVESLVGQTEQGLFTGTIDKVKQVAQTLFRELDMALPDDWKSNAKYQELESLQNEITTTLLHRMGARPTNIDLEFLVKSLTNMGMTKEANLQIVGNMRSTMLRELRTSIDRTLSRVKRGGEYIGDEESRHIMQVNQYQDTMDGLVVRQQGGEEFNIRTTTMLNRYRSDQGLPAYSPDG